MPSRLRSESVSRSRSHQVAARDSGLYLPNDPADLALSAGIVGEEAADVLHHVGLHHSHEAEETLVDGEVECDDDVDTRERALMATRAWWKRPAPWWFLVMSPLSIMAAGATLAPRVEILTMLVCDQLKPEYTGGRGMEDLGIHPWGAVPTASPFQVHLNTEGPNDVREVEYMAREMNGNGTMPPPYTELCKSDPVVQAGVATIQGAMITLMGILVVMTVGWWSSLSDRYGRIFIIGMSMSGGIVEELNFVLVSVYSKRLPGGPWFLLFGSVMEGSLGGMSTTLAAVYAYMSDCTTPDQRSHTFSLFMGALLVGLAIGPAIGGQIVKYTGSALSVFYLAFSIRVLTIAVLWFVVPESRSSGQMTGARQKTVADRTAAAAKNPTVGARVLAVIGAPLQPLAIFIPPVIIRPGKAKRRDWSLTLVAVAQASMATIVAALPYKVQYALARFHWTSVDVGYLLTSIGTARAVYLVIILPILIKALKPKESAVQLPVAEGEPLAGPSTPTSAPAHPSPQSSMARFDLALARVSLLIDAVGYALIAFATTGTAFIGASVAGAFGGGFGPAVQAVALELFARRPDGSVAQAGRLFGALSALSASVSQVLGPALFGGVYFASVGVFPQAIFVLSALLAALSLGLLLCVRLPQDDGDTDAEDGGLGREVTVIADEDVGGTGRRKVTATD